jgi:hypothetical protein
MKEVHSVSARPSEGEGGNFGGGTQVTVKGQPGESEEGYLLST